VGTGTPGIGAGSCDKPRPPGSTIVAGESEVNKMLKSPRQFYAQKPPLSDE
jgi:hypothetical protein